MKETGMDLGKLKEFAKDLSDRNDAASSDYELWNMEIDPKVALELIERLQRYETALQVIATGAPRDDDHETAAHSNYYRLRAAWTGAKAALNHGGDVK